MLFESECENLEIGKVSGGGVVHGGMGRGGVGVVKLCLFCISYFWPEKNLLNANVGPMGFITCRSI